jgi:hypothetical protein
MSDPTTLRDVLSAADRAREDVVLALARIAPELDCEDQSQAAGLQLLCDALQNLDVVRTECTRALAAGNVEPAQGELAANESEAKP